MEDMTWDEIEEKLKTIKTVIVPFGSCEEHGYHLPVYTDTIIAYELSKKASLKSNVFVAPSVSYGVCRTTNRFPGTITLTWNTQKSIAYDIIDQLSDQGFEKIIFFTGHAGKSHTIALREGGFEIQTKKKVKSDIYNISITDLVDKRIMDLLETEAFHAGELETSIMLAIRPSLVRMEKAVIEYPMMPRYLVKDTGRHWMKSGVMGDPTKATLEKGKKILVILVENFLKFLREVNYHPTSRTAS